MDTQKDFEVTKEMVDIDTTTGQVINSEEEVPVAQTKSKKITHVKSKKQKEETQLDNETVDTINQIVDDMRTQFDVRVPLDSIVPSTQISEWKKQYGDVYRTDLNDEIFIWHKLRRRDYINLMSDTELNTITNNDLKVFLRQEKIMKTTVLFPTGERLENIIDANAGVAGNISDEIMLASGFKPVRSEKV